MWYCSQDKFNGTWLLMSSLEVRASFQFLIDVVPISLMVQVDCFYFCILVEVPRTSRIGRWSNPTGSRILKLLNDLIRLFKNVNMSRTSSSVSLTISEKAGIDAGHVLFLEGVFHILFKRCCFSAAPGHVFYI